MKHQVKYVGAPSAEGDEASVRADRPIPVESSVFYFEVTIAKLGNPGRMSIGVMPQSASLSKLPGSEPHSVALTNDGRIGNGSSFTPCGTAYSANDVIGCCVNFSDNVILFTKNGHQAAEIAVGRAMLHDKSLYPAIGLSSPRREVHVNFGQEPFVFNFEHHKTVLQTATHKQILQTELPSNTHAQLHKMVLEYLEHMGYLQTAKEFGAFAKLELKSNEQDILDRQVIRNHILKGDIDAATREVNTRFRGFLDRSPHLKFKLFCRHFVETVLATTEQTDEALTHILNMGEELHRLSKLPDTLCDETEAIFEEATSLLAFSGADNPVHRRLMDPKRRWELAAAVNSALLLEQGQKEQPMLLQVFGHVGSIVELMRDRRVGLSALLDVQGLLDA